MLEDNKGVIEVTSSEIKMSVYEEISRMTEYFCKGVQIMLKWANGEISEDKSIALLDDLNMEYMDCYIKFNCDKEVR